ncbi:hypothetical protein FBU30_000961 [Linnemannia zychae]|nr:hypothetical protein FBU30_000961 [Linnemannia zychae]
MLESNINNHNYGTASGRFAAASDHLLYRGRISPEDPLTVPSSRSPHTTPLSSPLSSPRRYPTNPNNTQAQVNQIASFDMLPPAMSAHGAMPAPSQEHSDMDYHNSILAYEDDDEQLEDHRSSRRRSPQSHSRPSSPPPPPTTATTIPLISLSPSVSSGGPSSSTASPSQTMNSGGSSDQQSGHGHTMSPFSFFSHGSHSPTGEREHTKTLKIELSNPEIVLKAGQTTLLEGVVYVNLYKATKVKSLHLEFSGRSSVTWVDDNAYSPATRHQTSPHIEHSWALIPHQHKQPAILFPPGQYSYPFSMELTDVLPETLTTTHGKVAYRLTATLTKPGLTFNSSTVTLPVTILRRHPAQASRAYQRGGRAVSAPEDKIKYKVTMPQTRVPHSTKIPLQVSITAPTPRTVVQVLQVGLWERVVYRADGRKRVDMRLVKIQKSEGWDRPANHQSEAWNWNKVLLFDMPHMGSDLNNCNPSADNGLMKVTHILRFSILGTDGTKRFRVENEIDIKVLAFEDDYQIDPEDSANGENGGDGELPSYLTSFSTPRVSFDSERDMDPGDDDILRAMLQRIHLPSYAESEEDANSRNPSRDVSRSTSRAASRTPSRNPSRNPSPERGYSSNNHGSHHHLQQPFHPYNQHQHFLNHHHLTQSPFSSGYSSTTPGSPVPTSPQEPTTTTSEAIGPENSQDRSIPSLLLSSGDSIQSRPPVRESPSPNYEERLQKSPW